MNTNRTDLSLRKAWVDLLRIFCTFGVISIHGKCCYNFEIGTVRWAEYNLFNLSAIYVPLFLCVSGMLTLSREVSIENAIKNKAFRIIKMRILSLVLCCIGAVILVLKKDRPFSFDSVMELGYGTSFLAVLFGCYLVAPFLCRIVEDRKLESYFIVLGFVFGMVVPQFCDLDFMDQMPRLAKEIAKWLDYAEILVPLGAAWYFVLGHYLDRIASEISKRAVVVFFVACNILWYVATVAFSYDSEKFVGIRFLTYGRYYGSYVAPLLAIYVASYFLFFRVIIKDIKLSKAFSNAICHVGRNCMLIYLLHGVVIEIFRNRLPHNWCGSFGAETIIEVILYFAVAYGISLVLERLPFVKNII